MTTNIFRETADEIDEAREALIATANSLRLALSDINRYGDTLGSKLAVQADGFAYGEIYDGFKILMQTLFPDDGVKDRAGQIIEAMYNSDFTVLEAVQYVNDQNSPRWGYSTEDIREDLVRYRAWLRGLEDGVVDHVKIVGEGSREEAVAWLTSEINECLAALAYRNEPVDPVQTTAGSLIADWLTERCTNITDRSVDTYNDWQAAIDQAKAKAKAANIPWDDAFVPSYIRERLEDNDD